MKIINKIKEIILEESVLIASVIKWVILAACTGIFVGVGGTVFLRILAWSINQADSFDYTFLFLPLAFLMSVLLTKYFAPDAAGHGTEKVIEAVHRHAGKIPVSVVPVKLLATVITLAFGGSAGKEGPCAQIGAGIASFFAQTLKLDEMDRRKLVICGISAGFATVFGTPIAGSIFGVEVLFVGSILYDVLLPSFIAGITAYQISVFFNIQHLQLPNLTIPSADIILILKMILAGIIFGVFANCLIIGLAAGRQLTDKLKINAYKKALIGGLLLIILALIFGRQYLGLGQSVITDCINGQYTHWTTPLLKILFTSITLSFGGSGGIVTPIFFIGSSAGAVFAPVLNLDIGFLASIGFVCLLAGSANTPIAASIMAIEVFGSGIGSCAAIACVVTYLISGHRSVFPSQVLAVRKSRSIITECGQEMHALQISYQEQDLSLLPNFMTLWAGRKKDQ